MENKIKTITGVEAFPNECRLVNGNYYLIGNVNIENSGDIYDINGRFVRFETGRLVFNISNNSYELTSSSQSIKGIIDYNNGNIIYGNFIYNPLYDFKVYLKDGKTELCYRKCKLPLDYREKKSTGDYYHITLLTVDELISLKKVTKQIKESFNYNSDGQLEHYSKMFEMNYKPDYLDITESLAQVTKDLSFGLEFETVEGIIPNNKLNYLPLIPLRDGSIEGLEYATVPLQGEKGIQAMIDSVKELSKRTRYDSSCSLHLHVGNIPRTPEFILAFYRLYSIISDEMFDMFPLYKKYNFGVKRKHYTKPYDFIKLNSVMDPVIDTKAKVIDNFSVLFNHLTEFGTTTNNNFNAYNNDLTNVLSHPRDPNNTAKWNIANRYHVVNFIPLIFGNKKTIEFRIHTPTYNNQKIINFLLINSILINYTINNTNDILKNYRKYTNFGLGHIINDYIYNIKNKKIKHASTIIDQLGDYINKRKDFTFSQNRKGNNNYNETDFKYKGYLDLKRTVTDAINTKYSDEESYYKPPTFNIQNTTINNHAQSLADTIAKMGSTPRYSYSIDDLDLGLGGPERTLQFKQSIPPPRYTGIYDKSVTNEKKVTLKRTTRKTSW